MSPEKYAAAKRLNQLENTMNQINENIAKVEGALAECRRVQSMTALMISSQRAALAAMPDGDV